MIKDDTIWDKIWALREEMIAYIKEKVIENGGEVSYFDHDDPPSLNSSEDDEYVFSLDGINIKGNTLYFNGSSACSDTTWRDNEISTDALWEIYQSIDEVVATQSSEDERDWANLF